MSETNETEPLNRKDSNAGGDDVNSRDPKKINEDVAKVNFADVIAEPDGIRSLDWVWKCSDKSFTLSKRFFYCSLSTIFSLPLALLWGLLFAFLSFWQIWFVVPCLKSCWIVFHCVCQPCMLAIKSFFQPAFKVVVKFCKGLRGMIRKEA